MGQKLKTYQIQLTVKGPVFIGDGNQIQKKEYVFLNRNTIGVVDAVKLYFLAQKLHIQNDLERFMVEDTREDLKHWSIRNHVSLTDLKKVYEIYRKCRRPLRRKRQIADHDMRDRSLWKSVYTGKFVKRNA